MLTDQFSDKAQVDTVSIDNADASAIVAKHLCKPGYRHVVLVASDLELEPIRERCNGMLATMKHAEGSAEGTDSKIGAQRLSQWFKRDELPTTVITVTNMTTLATLTCLAERRVNIGSQTPLVSFDDYLWMSSRYTLLIAVHQLVEDIAYSIWDRLSSRIVGEVLPTKSIEYRCSL